MRLSGPLVTLRPSTVRDLEPVHQLWLEPGVRRFLFDDRSLSAAEARTYLQQSEASFRTHGYGMWLAFVQGHEGLAGFSGLMESPSAPPNLIVGVAPMLWRRGIGTEAAWLVLQFAFESLGLGEVLADVDEPNVASVRLLSRLGFSQLRRCVVEGRPFLYYGMARERREADGAVARLPRRNLNGSET